MTTLIRTNSGHQDFKALVQLLDADLAIRDGKEHAFYHQFNSIDNLQHVILLYENEKPVACGALKPYAAGTMEVKRMYTLPQARGNGYAASLLTALEQWAAEDGATACILETGLKQPEAIALYKKCGYAIIPNYGQYAGVENSLCFEKKLSVT